MQLTEAQVTAAKLVDLFSQAYIDTYGLDGDQFYVKGDVFNTRITVDSNKKIIGFLFLMPLENSSSKNIFQKVNMMNDRMLFVRFSTAEDQGKSILFADYHMTFEKGIMNYHIINMSKKFENIVVGAVREFVIEN